MAKSSERATRENKPTLGRGRHRFAPDAEPDRRVLPERPRREIDNEIVAELLGGDPAKLISVASVQTAIKPVQLNSPVQIQEDSTSSESQGVESEQSHPQIANRALIEVALPTASEEKEPLLEGRSTVDASFEAFVARWKHALRKGQLKMCEALFHKTYALGRTDCETSYSELSRLTGLTLRQCFNVIGQLESLEFVERTRLTGAGKRKAQGSRIIFHLFPKN
jgi:hypothetical protein